MTLTRAFGAVANPSVQKNVVSVVEATILTAAGGMPAIRATYAGLNIVASGVYQVGSWRKQVLCSYQRATVPAGKYAGSHVDATTAFSNGAVTGDWFFNTDTQTFHEITGPTTSTRIYRAGTPQMPALVGITVTASRVIVFDLTRAEMWMEFVAATNNLISTTSSLTSVAFAGSRMYIGSAGGGLHVVDFATDTGGRHTTTANGERYYGTIAERNDGRGMNTTTVHFAALPDLNVNAVATYLSGSNDLNEASVEIPHVLAGTNAGLAQINPTGTVFTLTRSSGNQAVASVSFNEAGPDLMFTAQNGNATAYQLHRHDGLLTLNRTAATFEAVTNVHSAFEAGNGAGETRPGITQTSGAGNGFVAGSNEDNRFAYGAGDGLTLFDMNETLPLQSLAAYVTTANVSGWMKGAIRGAWMGGKTTGAVTGTFSDLSGNSNTLTITGSLTRTAVATGAELGGVSGFSAGNFAQSAANMDTITTGDFAFYGWVNIPSGTDTQIIFDRNVAGQGDTVDRIRLNIDTNRAVVASIEAATIGTSATGLSGWHFYVFQRSATTATFYLNGLLVASASNSVDLADAGSVVRYGLSTDGLLPWTGSMALQRVTTTPLTAAEILSVYRREIQLFQRNTACTLSGSAVTGLSHDPKLGRYLVATSAGVNVFRGLVRVETLTGTKTPSQHDGTSVRGNGTSIEIDRASLPLRTLAAELRG